MKAQARRDWSGLPPPGDGRLVVYFSGPGFGESTVLALPDGKWLVVDSCSHHGTCVPLSLLRHFGVQTLDLVVVTHPDLDHIGGLAELLESIPVRRLWRYPQGTQIRELVLKWRRKYDPDGRLSELEAAMESMENLADSNNVHIPYCTSSWPRDCAYRLTCIAPVSHDWQAALRAIERALVDLGDGRVELAEKIVAAIKGENVRVGGHPNQVSLALQLEWGSFKLLLAGDVEKGDASEKSGWRGVLGELREEGQLDLLQDVTVVKVAHHGSDGSFLEEAWNEHSRSGRVRAAVVTPFSKGGTPPPHVQTLSSLRRFADLLFLTNSEGTVADRPVQAGWHVSTDQTSPTSHPVVTLVVDADATPVLTCHGSAREFRNPLPRKDDGVSEPEDALERE